MNNLPVHILDFESLSLKVGAMEPLGFFDPAGFSKVGDKALQHDRVDVLNIKC